MVQLIITFLSTQMMVLKLALVTILGFTSYEVSYHDKRTNNNQEAI